MKEDTVRKSIAAAFLLLFGLSVAGGVVAVDVAAQEKPKCVDCY